MTVASMWHAPSMVVLPEESGGAYSKPPQQGPADTTTDAMVQLYRSALYLINQAMMAAKIPSTVIVGGTETASIGRTHSGTRRTNFKLQVPWLPCAAVDGLNSLKHRPVNVAVAKGVSLASGRVLDDAAGVDWVAGTASAWLALSKLFQPTIPPMVRTSATNYLPGLVVCSNEVFARGYASFLVSGWEDFSQCPELAPGVRLD
jgi:hypothetical protein